MRYFASMCDTHEFVNNFLAQGWLEILALEYFPCNIPSIMLLVNAFN